MKIVTIIGARPQFVKAAVVSRALRKHHASATEIIIHTGQHYDNNMSEIFFEEMNIPKPNYNLGIGGGTHGQNTGRMLEKIENTLIKEKPDWVLVYGDTDSTLAGALAATKLHIPVAHVEAGLRSYNRNMPEEVNRVLTDHASTLLFTPTKTATQNLVDEGIYGKKVQEVGDVMFDAALYYGDKAKKPLGLTIKNNFILSTLHRAENTDNSKHLLNILRTLDEIAEEIPVILPLHPRTHKLLNQTNYNIDNITILEPVGYLQMIWLLKHCKLVVTDSGGLQKEAYFFRKPCVTTRNETEWVELVENNYNILVGSEPSKIRQAVEDMKDKTVCFKTLYGDGDSGCKIGKLLF